MQQSFLVQQIGLCCSQGCICTPSRESWAPRRLEGSICSYQERQDEQTLTCEGAHSPPSQPRLDTGDTARIIGTKEKESTWTEGGRVLVPQWPAGGTRGQRGGSCWQTTKVPTLSPCPGPRLSLLPIPQNSHTCVCTHMHTHACTPSFQRHVPFFPVSARVALKKMSSRQRMSLPVCWLQRHPGSACCD